MKRPTLKLTNPWQIVLVILAIALVLVAAATIIVIPSPFAPLLVLAGIAVPIVLYVWLRKPLYALYFTLFVLLLPLGLIPAQIQSYLNRSVTVISLAFWLIDITVKRKNIRLPVSTVFMLGFIVWAAISLLWANIQASALEVLQTYVLRLFFFLILVVNQINTKKNLDGLMKTLALSGGFLVVAGLVTLLLKGYSPGSRFQVLDMNENALGLYLLISMPAVLWLVRPTRQTMQIKKWIAMFFLLATIGLIGLSGSRGSAISLGIILITFLLWKQTRAYGLFTIIIACLALITVPILFSTTIDRFLGVTGETALGGRESLWSAGWLLIKDHVFTGVGIGNSSLKVIPYMINLGARGVSLVWEPLHNPVLVIWADTGLIGLLLYLGVMASAVLLFSQRYLQSRRLKHQYLMPYFALISSVFLGFMASWIKGGGMESDFSYFLMLAMLLIPSSMQEDTSIKNEAV